MRSFISEDDIEQAICNRLSQPEYGWKRIECDSSVEKQDDVGETGRSSVKECILPEVFRKASNILQFLDGNRWILLHGSNYFLATFLVTFRQLGSHYMRSQPYYS